MCDTKKARKSIFFPCRAASPQSVRLGKPSHCRSLVARASRGSRKHLMPKISSAELNPELAKTIFFVACPRFAHVEIDLASSGKL